MVTGRIDDDSGVCLDDTADVVILELVTVLIMSSISMAGIMVGVRRCRVLYAA